MNLQGLRKRKLILITAIVLTAVMPLVFVRLDESSSILNILKLFAKTGSLCGTILLIWQFLLGFGVSFALPEMAIQSGNQTIETIGNPLLEGTLGLQWSFGDGV